MTIPLIATFVSTERPGGPDRLSGGGSGVQSRLPPSTGMIVPLTKLIVVASPRITAATSSGWPIRLSGLLAILWARCCGLHIRVIGVSIKLGATATTRISGANARASDIVIACTPALAAA